MNKLGKAVLIDETIMVVGFISYVAGATDIVYALRDSTLAGFNATKYDVENNYSGGFRQLIRLALFRAATDIKD